MSLAVHPEMPPDGFEVKPGSYEFVSGLASLKAGLKPYHACRRCKGFVEGHTTERREDSIGPLSGRRGVTYCCRRCGWELGFHGIMS